MKMLLCPCTSATINIHKFSQARILSVIRCLLRFYLRCRASLMRSKIKSSPKSDVLERILVRMLVNDFIIQNENLRSACRFHKGDSRLKEQRIRSNFRANERRESLLTIPNAAESQEYLIPRFYEAFILDRALPSTSKRKSL